MSPIRLYCRGGVTEEKASGSMDMYSATCLEQAKAHAHNQTSSLPSTMPAVASTHTTATHNTMQQQMATGKDLSLVASKWQRRPVTRTNRPPHHQVENLDNLNFISLAACRHHFVLRYSQYKMEAVGGSLMDGDQCLDLARCLSTRS